VPLPRLPHAGVSTVVPCKRSCSLLLRFHPVLHLSVAFCAFPCFLFLAPVRCTVFSRTILWDKSQLHPCSSPVAAIPGPWISVICVAPVFAWLLLGRFMVISPSVSHLKMGSRVHHRGCLDAILRRHSSLATLRCSTMIYLERFWVAIFSTSRDLLVLYDIPHCARPLQRPVCVIDSLSLIQNCRRRRLAVSSGRSLRTV